MTLLEKIQNMSIFHGLSQKEKNILWVTEQSLEEYAEGQIIIHEGDNDSNLYLLVEGQVMITKAGYEYIVNEIAAGEIFGEMAYLTKTSRHNNVIAKEKCLVVKMDELFFKKVGASIKARIEAYLINLLVKRLDEMNETLVKVVTKPLFA